MMKYTGNCISPGYYREKAPLHYCIDHQVLNIIYNRKILYVTVFVLIQRIVPEKGLQDQAFLSHSYTDGNHSVFTPF